MTRSSFVSSDVPTPAPSTSKATNAASMITLAGAVASLGTSINHQTMISDHHITKKVQGFITLKDYLTDLEKSLAGEYYSLQTTLASGLMSMLPSVAKLTLHRKVKTLMKELDIEKDMEDMSVSDCDRDFGQFLGQLFFDFDFVICLFLLTFLHSNHSSTFMFSVSLCTSTYIFSTMLPSPPSSLVFVSPILGPVKDRDWSSLFSSPVFQFLRIKTGKRPVHMNWS